MTAVQHHIVNSLGWASLRPQQERAVEPLLRGDHALLLAPTAGGKTEAAMFPVFSRRLTDGWTGLTVLYICPLRALLNNLHPRLEHYGRLLGRRVEIWHGDTPDAVRRRIVSEPPDVLLTTPESLEVMLTTLPRGYPHRATGGGHPAVSTSQNPSYVDQRGGELGAKPRSWRLCADSARGLIQTPFRSAWRCRTRGSPSAPRASTSHVRAPRSGTCARVHGSRGLAHLRTSGLTLQARGRCRRAATDVCARERRGGT